MITDTPVVSIPTTHTVTVPTTASRREINAQLALSGSGSSPTTGAPVVNAPATSTGGVPAITTAPPQVTQSAPPATTAPTESAVPPVTRPLLERKPRFSNIISEPNGLNYDIITKIDGIDVVFKYNIIDGIVQFDYKKNPHYRQLVTRSRQNILAGAIISAAREINGEHLSGRTVKGIAFELDCHYIALISVFRHPVSLLIDLDGANPADMGSLNGRRFACGNADDYEPGSLFYRIFSPIFKLHTFWEAFHGSDLE